MVIMEVSRTIWVLVHHRDPYRDLELRYGGSDIERGEKHVTAEVFRSRWVFKMNDATSFQPSESALGINKYCGFFCTTATMNLCFKCFNDLRIKDEQEASAKGSRDKLVNKVIIFPPQTVSFSSSSSSSSSSAPETVAQPTPAVAEEKLSNRCLTCNKKVGMMGFKGNCGEIFLWKP
ncbi:hypothetical protein L6452_36872 [Arctium lappa]|uniref:Uncharacterized protein n=1 Tax=Arctium lappa TaxID=4217 RepID=A0ACB8Y0T5_ARCLA|nr:hypothetical protein L6452_36872 [Arctium lappa]